MSAKFQQFQDLQASPITAATAFTPAPMLFPLYQSPDVASGGPVISRAPPVVAASPGEFPEYPSPHEDDDDEKLVYTYGSFQQDPITTNTHGGTWSLAVPVPIPSIEEPTLLELSYMTKYATTCDSGNSTIQTDTILTTQPLPEGIVTQTADLGVYRNKAGYGPRMIDHDAALRLSTTLGVKSNGGGGQWSHFFDNQHTNPKVCVTAGDEAYLYLIFHVCEYPTVNTVRSLYVEVSATWQKEAVNRKAKEEEERKAREEAAKKAREEAERKARWQEEKQARIDEKAWREEEKRARREEKAWRDETRQAMALERAARAEEKQWREDDKQWKAKQKKSAASAPAKADKDMQDLIATKMKELNLTTCDSGYEFVKTADGYECTGGSHKITWAQLGMA